MGGAVPRPRSQRSSKGVERRWSRGPSDRASPMSRARPASARRPCPSRSMPLTGSRPRPRMRIRGVALRSATRRIRWLGCSPSDGRCTIGVLTPQALSVVFRNPFFGAFSAGRRARRRGARLRAPFHLAVPGQPHRGDDQGDGRRRGRGRSERGHPEIEDIRRAGLPLVLVDSQALPEHGSVESRRCGRCPQAAHLSRAARPSRGARAGRRATLARRGGSRRRHRPATARLSRRVRAP